jgi:hypothetical protein
MRRGHRGLLGTALVVAVMAIGATSASAGIDYWFSSTLNAGFGFASVDAHSINYIEGDANYNGFCIAKDQGISGYAPASHTPVGTVACASSGGFVARTENGACCYHGWIANGLGNAISVYSSTHYSY